MRGVHRLVGVGDALVRQAGRLTSAPYLPVRFHDSWLWLARESWTTSYLPYEPEVARALRRHIGSDSVFYDIGAHIGLWSLYVARLIGSQGSIVSCEPSDAYGPLVSNVNCHACIECLQVAVGAVDGPTLFYGQGTATSGSVLEAVTEINRRFNGQTPIAPRPVEMLSLATLAAQRRPPDVVKIDVEGHEFRVLQGAAALMERASPVWIVEVHPPQLRLTGDSEQAVLELLRDHRYSIEIIDRNANSLYTVVATRTP